MSVVLVFIAHPGAPLMDGKAFTHVVDLVQVRKEV
jgi:hypothetical protein